jgi:hypothetical protein
MFADRLAAGNLTGPLAGDWLMSDRPPLQAGVLLLFQRLGGSSALASEFIATLCQLGWLPALAALGSALKFGPRQVAAGLFFAAASGFFLLHTLYTWPKLMAAALFITAVALVISAGRDASAKPLRTATACGALLALAVLAHGGAWFSILALPALPAAWIALRRFGVKGGAVLLLTFVVLNAPWAAFKRFTDPPGNRLEKWHLAGAMPVDDRTTFEAIRDAYATTPVRELWHTRVVNVQYVAGFLGRHNSETWGHYIRRLQFFHFVPTVGVPLLGVCWLLLLWIRKRARGDGSAGLILHVAATLLVWIALIFQLGGTIVHAGGYAPLALLIFLGGAAMGRWHIAAFTAAAAAHVAVFLAGWILTTPVVEGAMLSPLPMALAAVLMVGALLVFPVLERVEGRKVV